MAACDPPRHTVTWPIPRNNNQFVAKCLARWKIDLPDPRPEKRDISVESAWLGTGLTARRAWTTGIWLARLIHDEGPDFGRRRNSRTAGVAMPGAVSGAAIQ